MRASRRDGAELSGSRPEGTPCSRATGLHPEAAVESHPYYESGHYLVLTGPGQQYAMIFETDGKVVTSFRAGEREPVGYIEGCL